MPVNIISVHRQLMHTLLIHARSPRKFTRRIDVGIVDARAWIYVRECKDRINETRR